MITLKIKVTKAILEMSKRCGMDGTLMTQNCAVSLAVRDIFPDAATVQEGIFPFAYVKGAGYPGSSIPLPKEAGDFICDFDLLGIEERLLMPELEFEINIPDEVIEMINIDEIMPLLENHPTLELVTPEPSAE